MPTISSNCILYFNKVNFNASPNYVFFFQMEKLKELNEELSCGTGAAIAILKNNRLYVANVGESRVLLCKTDRDDVLRVVQPTVDHNLTNLDEVMRLKNLGLNAADGKINGMNIYTEDVRVKENKSKRDFI